MERESSKVIESVINYFEKEINETIELLELRSIEVHEEGIGEKITEVLYSLISKQTWRLINKTFVYEFHEFRKQHGYPISKNSTTAYEIFLSELNRDVINQWFKKYKLLNEIIHKSIFNSCKFITEVLNYYINDKSILINKGFLGECSEINNIVLLDSDPHNNGQMVVLFEDTECRKFIFKNRDFNVDNLIDDIFKTISKNSDTNMESPIPQNIAKDGYGWQKFIEQTPVPRENIGEAFYNLGYYSALFSTLGTTDLHDENIIFSEAVPYFIDLETALRPRLNENESSLIGEIQKSVSKSIAGTTIIPSKLLNNSYNYLIGAINTPYPQETAETVFSFKNVGTDAIDIAKKKVVLNRLATPLLCVDREIIDPVGYQSDFISGYKRGFMEIMDNRFMISEKIRAFKGKLRVVLRPTAQYFLIMDACLFPENLVDDFALKKVLKYFKPISFIENKIAANMIYEEECNSLLQGDIPYFSVDSDKLNLIINNTFFKNVYSVSAIDNALENIKYLNSSQLLKDDRFITEGFAEIKIRNAKNNIIYHDNSVMFIDLLQNLKMNNFEMLSNWWEAQSTIYKIDNINYRGWNNGSYGELPFLYSTPTLISFHDAGGVGIMLESLFCLKETSKNKVLFEEAKRGLVKLKNEIYNDSEFPVSIIAGEESIDFILSKKKQKIKNLEHKIKNVDIPMGDIFNGKLGLYLVLSTYSGTNIETILQGKNDLEKLRNNYLKFGIAHGKLGELWTKFRIYSKIGLEKECLNIFYDTMKYVDNETNMLQGWCNGYAGILMILVEMAKILKIKTDFYYIAEKCVELHGDSTIDLSVCHGASGVIQSLLFSYTITKDKRYLELTENYWNLVYQKARKNGFYIGESNREYLLGYMLGWSGVIDTILLLNLIKSGKKHWIPINLSTLEYQEKLKKEI